MPTIHDITARLNQVWNDGDEAFRNTWRGVR
jgi:hypothetical protein